MSQTILLASFIKLPTGVVMMMIGIFDEVKLTWEKQEPQ